MLVIYEREDNTIDSFETDVDVNDCTDLPSPLNEPDITQWFFCSNVIEALNEISNLKKKIEILRKYIDAKP